MSLAASGTTAATAQTTTTPATPATPSKHNGSLTVNAILSNKMPPIITRSATDFLPNPKVMPSTGAFKKHSTASSSLSSLASDEIVEIHQNEKEQNGITEMNNKIPITKNRGRAGSHQSHYSTDKSASSGYYSSNVCSTYSLEEHIYSEPTVEINKKEKSIEKENNIHKESVNAVGSHNDANSCMATNVATKKPVLVASGSNKIENNASQSTMSMGQAATAISVMRTLDFNRRYRFTDPLKEKPSTNENISSATNLNLPSPINPLEFNEKLRILESSIENLDRHLKAFPGLTSAAEAIVSYVQTPSYEKSRGYSHLPTIKEAASSSSPTKLQRDWSDEPVTDDSLLDIDLDSFLLDERKKTSRQSNNINNNNNNNAVILRKGIDNPSFLIGEQEENHYKCAKYINSCPEDAYRVESDIIAPTRSSLSEKSIAVSVDLYPKRYEDQLHFQNTRELLEDVRDKIRLLTRCQEQKPESYQLTKVQNVEDGHIPKELNSMISTLRKELELYLERMNQHSELEIRQLCTGLVKNQNIVKMKNAFERRRSLTHEGNENIITGPTNSNTGIYEAMGQGPISIRQQHITTIKCSSDPNFKMKRKSLTEVFPLSECYIETTTATTTGTGAGTGTRNPADPSITLGSQLHRNLNFHHPQIQLQHYEKVDNKLEGNKNEGPGSSQSASGSGCSASGGETSETNDKDSILDWHRKKPSIWEMYYGTNRLQQSLLGANTGNKKNNAVSPVTTPSTMCYPSSRPESDFTLDLPRAEQLRIKMEKEKKFRQRCRVITSFLSLIFFLLTVMVVSLVLTRGKRMFGSMI